MSKKTKKQRKELAQQNRWKALGPGAQVAWSKTGVTRAETARQWMTRGFDPGSAAPWFALGLSADVAHTWLDILPPIEARAWLDAGVRTPAERVDWIAADIGLDAVKAWHAAGVRDVHAAQRWLEYGFESDRVNQLRKRGFKEPSEMRSWLEFDLTPEDAYKWIMAGVREPATAVAWQLSKTNPREAKLWISIGANRPDRAMEWTKAGCSAESAQAWRSCGVDQPDEVRALRRHGLRPSELHLWRTAGIADFEQIIRIRAAGLDPTSVKKFVRVGIQDLDALIELHSCGIDIAEIAEWKRIHVRGTSEMRAWRDAGFTPRTARPWTRIGIGLEKAAEWSAVLPDSPEASKTCIAAGMSSSDATKWRSASIEVPEPAISWHRQKFDADSATAWISVGIADPEIAASWRAAGFEPDDARRHISAGVTRPPSDGGDWSHVGIETTEAMRWMAIGIDDAEIAALWTAADIDPSTARPWVDISKWDAGVTRLAIEWVENGAEVAPESLIVWKINGFDGRVADAVRWSNARFKINEAIQWEQGGFTPDSARLASDAGQALPDPSTAEARSPLRSTVTDSVRSNSADDRFEKWLTRGTSSVINSPPLLNSSIRRVLRSLFERDYRLTPGGRISFEGVANDRPNEAWLRQVQARADLLQRSLKREPSWPRVFRSPSLTIDLSVTGKWAVAWVGVGHDGVIIIFDTTTFELDSVPDAGWARLAGGAALSWFIDCCVTLRADHPHFALSSQADPQTNRDVHVEYTPLPRFTSNVSSLRSGRVRAPQLHEVKGHVRHLGEGRTPSLEAVARAPVYLQRSMGPHDTFVQAHTRGIDEAHRELMTRLSKYSCLGDALGSA